MKKKLLLLFSLVLCMALLAGCGKNDADKKILPEDIEQNVLLNTTSNFEFWVSTDFSDASEDIFHYSEEDRKNFRAWTEMKEKLGELKVQSDPSYSVDWKEEIITSKINAEFNNGKIEYSLRFKISGDYADGNAITINEVQSTSQIMEKALMNTLMGMGTVFCVLILICLVISSFGLISKSQAKKEAAAKAAQEAKAPVQTAVMAPDLGPATEEVDDLELVAVITAAIMASMGDEAPAEGLVVRSIRKRNASSWKNA